MARKKRGAAAPKAVAKSEPQVQAKDELERIEAGLLLVIGLIWVLQVLNVITFGGQYFQMIGSILVLVIGATKFITLHK